MNETIYSVLTGIAFSEEDATFNIKYTAKKEAEGPYHLTENMIIFLSNNTDAIEEIRLLAGNLQLNITPRTAN